jgi:hypothetical protein
VVQCGLIGLVVWKKDLVLGLMDKAEERRKKRLEEKKRGSLPGD